MKIDKTSILEALEQGDVVLLSSLGFNAAGEVFNCVSRDIAVAAATELNADKLRSSYQKTAISQGRQTMESKTSSHCQREGVDEKFC